MPTAQKLTADQYNAVLLDEVARSPLPEPLKKTLEAYVRRELFAKDGEMRSFAQTAPWDLMLGFMLRDAGVDLDRVVELFRRRGGLAAGLGDGLGDKGAVK